MLFQKSLEKEQARKNRESVDENLSCKRIKKVSPLAVLDVKVQDGIWKRNL